MPFGLAFMDLPTDRCLSVVPNQAGSAIVGGKLCRFAVETISAVCSIIQDRGYLKRCP